jgi:hypothetical protein
MLRWITAIGAGIALGLSGRHASPWIAFVLFLVVAIGLGVSAARAKPKTAFWHGAALASTASALSGLLTLVLLYNAPPVEQPTVLPPWPLFALAMLFMAIVAGAIGGLAGLVLAKRFRSP